ncbi:MAG: tetratricopeptide repeat protein [Muribaculaceae bacterium]|nr:tetratricopeptide repeat protein [Muribaculaceae bacterium]
MKVKAISHIFLFVSLILLSGGCRRTTSENPILIHASHLLENEPDSITEAKQMLDSISPSSLNEGDRSLHALLSVKANDKLYIPHTSDSLILSSLKYEGKHPKRDFYPEALYYAGRVYSDLGDYPSAIHYFQAALMQLDSIKETTDRGNASLRGRILSQTGRLYLNLDLYSEATIYLREVIKINSSRKDYENIMFNNQLLGSALMNAGKMDSAKIHINRAYFISESLGTEHQNFMSLYKAKLHLNMGQPDSALYFIKNAAGNIWPDVMPWAYITTARIYAETNIPDSAFKYASLVVSLPDSSFYSYRRTAYSILLSKSVRDMLPKDSIYPMSIRLLEAAGKELSSRDLKTVAQQRNAFNYTNHQLKRVEAEKERDRFAQIIYLLLIVFCVVVILVMVNRNKRKEKIIRLSEANEILKRKIDDILRKKENVEESLPLTSVSSHASDVEKKNTLLLALKARIEYLCSISIEDKIEERILTSSTYNRIQEHISQCKSLNDRDGIWEELEDLVSWVSPTFISDFNLLTGGLSKTDKRLLLLIKCGIKPGQMAVLFSLTKQALNGRRTRLKRKLEANDFSIGSLDYFVRML